MGRRAFTLPEALLTLALFGLVLGLTASLLAGYSQFLRFTARQDRRLESTRALAQLCLDVQQAHRLLDPTGGPSSQVVLERVPPDQEWLPAPGTPFDPAAGPLEEVRYFVDGQRNLVRERAGRPSVVAESVGLSAAWVEPELLQVRLSVQEGPGVVTLQAEVARP